MRRRFLNLVAALLLFLPSGGCTRKDGKTIDPDMADLEAIRHADPEVLAAALDHGDGRFLAVAGYSVMAPRLDYEVDQDVLDRQGIRVIAGTTDTPRDERHARLINDARHYAARYNQLLLRKLSVGPASSSDRDQDTHFSR